MRRAVQSALEVAEPPDAEACAFGELFLSQAGRHAVMAQQLAELCRLTHPVTDHVGDRVDCAWFGGALAQTLAA